MNSEWQSFLTSSGAVITSGRVESFGAPNEEIAAANGDIIADLSHFGMLRATGEEAADFLQNQLSNDVRQVDDSRSQLNAYCTPKGRILALFRLFRREDAFYLRLPAELVPSTLKRLRMYVLRSKVVLDDAGEALARFGISGPNAVPLLEKLLPALPGETGAVTAINGITVIRVPGPHPRFELYGEPASLQPAWQSLSERARPVGETVWSWLDIRSGMPNVYEATAEAFVPQMVNLHLLDGVSFRKGCYPGQEIVARMHYLGKLKRRMYLAHLDSSDAPAIGSELFSEASESGQGTGKVVDARRAPEGGTDLLAVIAIADVESGQPVHIGTGQGPSLAFIDLPYPLEPDSSATTG